MPIVRADRFGSVLLAAEEARRARVKLALREAAERGLQIIVDDMPTDWLLRETGKVEETARGSKIVFDAPYAGYVEVGTLPHTPPLDPLIAWVTRHADQLGAETETDIRRIAFSVQQKIAAVGTEPHWFVRRNLPKIRAVVAELLRPALRLAA